MLAEFTAWLLSLVKAVFTAGWDWLTDAFIWLFKGLLDAFASLVAMVPVPSFMSQGLATLWGQMPAGVIWILSSVGVPAALAIIGAGFTFRLVRKLVTLGQW